MKIRLALTLAIGTIAVSDAFASLAKLPGKAVPTARRGHMTVPSFVRKPPLNAESGVPESIEDSRRSVLSLRGGDAPASPFISKKLFREMIAELIGTFLIVFVGTGSVASAIFTDSLVGLFQIASVWIIAVTIAICTTASISGAHLNPAISIAFAMVRPSKSFGWGKVSFVFVLLML